MKPLHLTTDALIRIAKNNGLISVSANADNELETLAYVTVKAETKFGEESFVMTRDEIEIARQKQAKYDGLWTTHYEQLDTKMVMRMFLHNYLRKASIPNGMATPKVI